jgi:hypothetical protein
MLSRFLPLTQDIENTFIENRSIRSKKQFRVSKPDKHKNKSPLTCHDLFFKKVNLESFTIEKLKEIIKYYKNNVSFEKTNAYTSSEIRNIKDFYDFKLSGKKKELIKRITDHLKKEKSAIIIQSQIRKLIVTKYIHLCGPGLKNRNLCVNDRDFYTLDPLVNISPYSFYSYEGSGNFVYGFDLSSIYTLFKNNKNGKFMNPYNRESMESIVPTLFRLNKITQIISSLPEEEKTGSVLFKNTTLNENPVSTIDAVSYNSNEVIAKLSQIRARTLNQRIENVFMEMDQLGNYTQSTWFSQLDRISCLRFFRSLYDIWNYRAQLSFRTRRNICPLGDPFSMITRNQGYSNLTEESMKSICVSVMEDITLTGIDIDFRTIGAFHVLSALTIVSLPARENMPWLYESIAF